jgi:hypothetical protein
MLEEEGVGVEQHPSARVQRDLVSMLASPVSSLEVNGTTAAINAAIGRFRNLFPDAGKVFHHSPRPLQVVRDLVLDRTPLLQKVVGESSPGEILKQLAEIVETEKHFAAVRGPQVP